jgi:hypothetical protein
MDPALVPLPYDGFIPPRDIKLPLFWQVRPAGWFIFVESHFRPCNILDETAKFHHLLSALPEDMVGQILDIVEALRTQLRVVEPGNPRALAARADKLWAVHTPCLVRHNLISATEMAEACSGACASSRQEEVPRLPLFIREQCRSCCRLSCCHSTKGSHPPALTRFASGLCFFHCNFADRATKCSPPCS